MECSKSTFRAPFSTFFVLNDFFCSACATDGMLEVYSQGERNIGNTLGCATCAIFLLLPHFDVICELSRDTSTATWNLLVFVDNMTK